MFLERVTEAQRIALQKLKEMQDEAGEQREEKRTKGKLAKGIHHEE